MGAAVLDVYHPDAGVGTIMPASTIVAVEESPFVLLSE